MLDLKAEGVEAGVRDIGHHDPLEPEFSILKSRVARMVKFEGGDPAKMDLVDVTKVAERVITAVSECERGTWQAGLSRRLGLLCLFSPHYRSASCLCLTPHPS